MNRDTALTEMMDPNESPSPAPMPDVDQVRAHLRGLLGRESVADDYVRLRIDVLRAQAAVLAGLDDSNAPPLAPAPRGEKPAIGPDQIPFDAALARRLFEAIARACRRYGHPGADLPRLRSAVRREPSLLEQMIRHAAIGPDEESRMSLGGHLGMSSDLPLFFARLLAAPFVTSAARNAGGLRVAVAGPRERLRLRGASPPSSGSCPICGSAPGLASLHPDEGARLLHCSLCGNPWRFTRLDCPLCGPQDQPSLVRLTVAGEDARWVEACDGCKRYLKVVDRRGKAYGHPFIPLVEEVAGLGVDLVAEREGYQRGPVYAALR